MRFRQPTGSLGPRYQTLKPRRKVAGTAIPAAISETAVPRHVSNSNRTRIGGGGPATQKRNPTRSPKHREGRPSEQTPASSTRTSGQTCAKAPQDGHRRDGPGILPINASRRYRSGGSACHRNNRTAIEQPHSHIQPGSHSNPYLDHRGSAI